MVDLTILSKKELIGEFDLILSEWQQCKQKINSFEAEISELKRRDNNITSDIRENMKFVKRQKKIDKKIKKVENQVVVVAVGIAALIRCVKIPKHFLIK